MRRALLLAGALAALVAAVADHSAARSAASRAWPPFVLVAGLLLVGEVAHRDGLFDRAAAVVGRLRGGGVVLFVALMALVATTTAVLNLDTSVAFLTPVLVLAARRRGLAEAPFLYGALFMANSASLLLPGSNLTNLLVLAREHVAGAVFAARMAPAWIAAIVVTTSTLVVWYRRDFEHDSAAVDTSRPSGGGFGLLVTVVAAAAVIALRSPALAVAAIGASAVAVAVSRRRIVLADLTETVDVPVLAGLFGLAVALGTLALSWSAPGHLMRSASAWETAAVGAIGSVVLNNLPAAVLFSARAPAHPRALLLGLDLGPNLAVTGSLSALLWFRSARRVGAQPSIVNVSRIGAVLVPLSLAAALGALTLFTAHGS